MSSMCVCVCVCGDQISFSVLDTRPLQQMVPACQEHNVKLLCYGTLLVSVLLPVTLLCSNRPNI